MRKSIRKMLERAYSKGRETGFRAGYKVGFDAGCTYGYNFNDVGPHHSQKKSHTTFFNMDAGYPDG